MSSIVIPREYTGTVEHKETLTDKVIRFTVTPPADLTYEAGQYASFIIEENRRPLSFATPAGGILEFYVDTSPGGVCSRYVEKLAVGDTVTFLAPYGRFIVDTTDTRPRLFIAAGTGIAPIQAQLMAQLTSGDTTPTTLVFGNRKYGHCFLVNELLELAQTYPHFTFIPTCEEESTDWPHTKGTVLTAIENHLPNVQDYTAYICGSPAMVTATQELLRKQGVSPEHIHTEQYT